MVISVANGTRIVISALNAKLIMRLAGARPHAAIEGKTTMAVPKRRVSKARQGKRRSHQHLKARQNTYCVRCGEAMKPHFVCSTCGWHNTQGREAVVIEEAEES
jgi:large subunit ribosomal protein L32